jgi:hypothetical protein
MDSRCPSIPIANPIAPRAQLSSSVDRASANAVTDEVSPISLSFAAAKDLTSGLGSCSPDKSDSFVNV